MGVRARVRARVSDLRHGLERAPPVKDVTGREGHLVRVRVRARARARARARVRVRVGAPCTRACPRAAPPG